MQLVGPALIYQIFISLTKIKPNNILMIAFYKQSPKNLSPLLVELYTSILILLLFSNQNIVLKLDLNPFLTNMICQVLIDKVKYNIDFFFFVMSIQAKLNLLKHYIINLKSQISKSPPSYVIELKKKSLTISINYSSHWSSFTFSITKSGSTQLYYTIRTFFFLSTMKVLEVLQVTLHHFDHQGIDKRSTNPVHKKHSEIGPHQKERPNELDHPNRSRLRLTLAQ